MENEEEIFKKLLKKASASSFEKIINLDLNNCSVDFNKYVLLLPKLINLKCLILSNNNTNQLPPFENLQSLEELYLRNFSVTPQQINKTSLSTDSDLTKSFITKIKTLTKLKHLVITGTKFDTNSSKDYIIHYLTTLETLNFERITNEKRQDVNNRIKLIREKHLINKSPTSAKILTTPNKTVVNRQQPQDLSTKKLVNTTSSIINISKSTPNKLQNQVQSSPKLSSPITKNKEQIVSTTSPQKLNNKVDFKLPPQIIDRNSPKHQPKIQSDVSSPLPIEIIPNIIEKTSDRLNGQSNLIQAISLLIGSITTLNDIDFIEDILYERKKILK
ncbi:hypothetical protein DDB_G0285185 [Dictyostelium discoideum AX4]|uniref:Putative protein DDB_G0285185 n=1 Tax=Dictyostelium discoideum TaxID=44689 RepID=Y6386_DICDI|nr:hypothetical protein DDB_G0285185 [Dictyostelium discoideum AX4]Q54NK3.1 RecName: Full=Putative protein DDB_G0285185 [Dictyostelium discoideum]EAL64849.1 hypothetical protein DDB_G0285185 [Dictyostelium discoideum AX4]|eukprot:XP_638359.1 hypothetical protein DDB_G0285185 [Dictyostelium discoideum AX4]